MLYKQTDRQQGTEKYITLLAVQFLGVLFIYLFLLPPAVARSLNTGCGLRNSISPVTHKQCSIFFLSSSSSFPRACKPSLVLSASGSIVCLLRRVFISFFFFFFFPPSSFDVFSARLTYLCVFSGIFIWSSHCQIPPKPPRLSQWC